MKPVPSRRRKRVHRMSQLYSVTLFFFTLIMIAGLGIVIPARPNISEKEKRSLAEFPSFHAKEFLNGDYFSDISLWYSDTFPLRDDFIEANKEIQKLYGFDTDEKLIGGNVVADAIPTEPTTSGTTEDATKLDIDTTAATSTENNDLEDAIEDIMQEIPESTVSPPNAMAMEAEIEQQIHQGMYVKDDASYTIYYYQQEPAETYAGALNRAAKKLHNTTNVYSILIPNNSGAVLPADELKKLGGSDQSQAIQYYYSLYNDVTGIDTIDTLREHPDDYLYFRTDHHWTAQAAYYVYENFCEAKGIAPNPLSNFEERKYEGFLGTSYAALQSDRMKDNPDIVYAYVPKGTNEMHIWQADGSEMDWFVVSDVTTWASNSKYDCFIGGDNPLSIIENPTIKDGSSCLVLKESYGNAFVPFLVDHYQTVYVVDFRYTDLNVTQYCLDNQIDDLIIMNNITIISSDSVANRIADILQ